MRQKKLILASFCLLIAIHGIAQSSINVQDPYYEFVDDDPNFAQFMGQLAVGFETDFSFRSEVPVGLYFHYDFSAIPVELDASGIFSILSERQRGFYRDNLSDNEFQRYSTFQVLCLNPNLKRHFLCRIFMLPKESSF